MRFGEAQYRAMASPLSQWEWKNSKSRSTPSLLLLPWVEAASRRFEANTGAAKPSLHVGFKNEPAPRAALQQAKFRSRRQKLLCIAGRQSIVASQNGSRTPV